QDKATGKHQTVTISGSSNLDKNDIERMIKEAENHSAEDKRRREEIEVRNEADSLIYSVERQLKEIGDQLQIHEKGRIGQLLEELRQLLSQPAASLEEIRGVTSDLVQASAAFQNIRAQSSGTPFQTGYAGQTGQTGDGAGEEIYDADYTDYTDYANDMN
ncbi:MAG: Hsp70 family protein, partial [Oscillospiraceae bacterium]|nr:Hsp70 family protein [Oscillospiraceae bacterium]